MTPMTQKALEVGFPSINQSINQALTLTYTQCPSDGKQPWIPAPQIQNTSKMLLGFFCLPPPPSFFVALAPPRIYISWPPRMRLTCIKAKMVPMAVKMWARNYRFARFGQQGYTRLFKLGHARSRSWSRNVDVCAWFMPSIEGGNGFCRERFVIWY